MPPARRTTRPSFHIQVAAAVAALALLVVFGREQWGNYAAAIARAERDTRNATALLAEHAARTFEAVEETLRAVSRVRDEVEIGILPADRSRLHLLLKGIHGTSPLYVGVGWIDAEGNQVATSRSPNPPPLNIAGQSHFRAQREGTASGLHVSETFRSVLDRRLIINTSLRLQDSTGAFAGVAGVALDPTHLVQVYQRVDLGPSQVMSLFRSDGTYLARAPDSGTWVGQSIGRGVLFRDHLPRAPEGTFHAASPIDGVERIVSYSRVADLPLVVAVSLSRDDALAGFWRRLANGGAWLGAILAMLGLGTWLLVVQMRRRESAQAELLASEARFRDFAASSGDWFWETDDQLRFTWVSDAVERVTGVPASWHYGKSRDEIGATGLAPGQWEEHQRTLQERRPFRDFEYRRPSPAGERWISVSGVPLFDQDGRFRGYRGSGRDVTALRLAEQRLRDAVEAIPGRFMLFDAADRLVYANRSESRSVPGADLARIGDTFEDILRKTVQAGLIPEAAADPEGWIAERLRQHRAAGGRAIVRRGGRVLEILETRTGDGGLMMLRFDVTERERAAEALRTAERLLRDAVESIPGSFLLFGPDGRLAYVNQNNATVVPEQSKFDRLGDTFETILRRALAAGIIHEARADPEAWVAERLRRHRAAAGSTIIHYDHRVMEVIERPTHDGGIMVLRFDVTERERSAEAQRAAREAADAANQAKSDFLSRMSHELRTPLNAIIGFAQMLGLNRPGNLTADQQDYCSYILAGGQHLLNLVNEVLDLAGVEAGRIRLSPERADVANLVAQVVETMRPVARKAGIELIVADVAQAPHVRADIQRLRQVMLNLLSNAIKYNRPSGSVTVTAAAVGDGRLRIAVADTGMGIAPENQAHLFEPFHRLGAEYTAVEGTGIGLALSKRLVEAMDGRIGYATAPGEGSTFWIDLPVAEAEAGAEDPASPRADLAQIAPVATAGGYSLLYVEDNPASLRLMEHLISSLPNVTMLSAPSGPLGLELALAHRPDVIVVDLNLPGLSGFDILARLKALPETRHIPVLALSAAAMPNDINRGIAAGFFRYLTKPLDVPLFLASIEAALAARQARPAASGA